jgi:hypothetical protein
VGVISGLTQDFGDSTVWVVRLIIKITSQQTQLLIILNTNCACGDKCLALKRLLLFVCRLL